MNIMRKLTTVLVITLGSFVVTAQADVPKAAPKAATKAAPKAAPKATPKAAPKIPKAKKIPPPPPKQVTFDTCLGCHNEFRQPQNFLQMRELMVKRVERGEMPPASNLPLSQRQRLIRQIQTLKG